MSNPRQYRVPHTAWHTALCNLPELGRVWEPCGHGDILRDLGVTVVGAPDGERWLSSGCAIAGSCYDFCDTILVAHPDFAEYKDILARLRATGKPWVTVLPDSKLSTLAVKDNFSDGGLCIMIPPGRIRFKRVDNRGRALGYVSNIDVFFYGFGLGTPKNLIFMETPATGDRGRQRTTPA